MNSKGMKTFRVPVELKNHIDAEVAGRRSTQTIEITMLLTEALEARRRSRLRSGRADNAEGNEADFPLGDRGSAPLGLIARVDALERELRKLKDRLREQMPTGDLA